MILEVYEHLLATYATALGIASTKGYPTWGRGTAIVPCVALELVEVAPEHARIGQAMATSAVNYRGWLFASHEPELCALTEAFIEWHKNHGASEVSARRVAYKLEGIKRHDVDPNVAPQQEQHAVMFLIKAVW